MAASPALPLLLLALLAAAADATAAPAPLSGEALCLKTTDPEACKRWLEHMPKNILEKLPAGASAVADQCILTAYWWAVQFKSHALVAVKAPKSTPVKCAKNCVRTLDAIIDALDPTGDGAGDNLKVPEEERLLAVHVSLADMLRRPPLCKTCCDGKAGDKCWGATDQLVTWYFARMWALLDFTNAVLDEVYPAAKTAAKTTARSSGNTVKNMKPSAASPEVVVTAAPPVTTFD